MRLTWLVKLEDAEGKPSRSWPWLVLVLVLVLAVVLLALTASAWLIHALI